MKLKKEFFLVIGISVFIIVLEIVTNIITEKSVEKIENQINEINSDLAKISDMNIENEKYKSYKMELERKIDKLKSSWFEEQDKLCVFSEHNELEKVSKCLIVLEENTRNKEFEIALSDGKEFLYWLNHIKEKDKLELKNIF
ncbi:MAG: DUF4363 family protein [Clostridia bacterium]|nr:DUF4363 family protein [Clostridia bacterium]